MSGLEKKTYFTLRGKNQMMQCVGNRQETQGLILINLATPVYFDSSLNRDNILRIQGWLKCSIVPASLRLGSLPWPRPKVGTGVQKGPPDGLDVIAKAGY